jgi:hypothetical protein
MRTSVPGLAKLMFPILREFTRNSAVYKDFLGLL